jgi:hypothetical protein
MTESVIVSWHELSCQRIDINAIYFFWIIFYPILFTVCGQDTFQTLIQNFIIPANLPDRNKLPDCFTRLIDKVLIQNIVAKIDFQDRLKVPVSDSFGQDFQKRIERKELLIRRQCFLHSDEMYSNNMQPNLLSSGCILISVHISPSMFFC